MVGVTSTQTKITPLWYVFTNCFKSCKKLQKSSMMGINIKCPRTPLTINSEIALKKSSLCPIQLQFYVKWYMYTLKNFNTIHQLFHQR